jgi:hypothetical protein
MLTNTDDVANYCDVIKGTNDNELPPSKLNDASMIGAVDDDNLLSSVQRNNAAMMEEKQDNIEELLPPTLLPILRNDNDDTPILFTKKVIAFSRFLMHGYIILNQLMEISKMTHKSVEYVNHRLVGPFLEFMLIIYKYLVKPMTDHILMATH